MTYKKIKNWDDRKGTNYWGTDRLDRMIKTKDLGKEEGALELIGELDLKAKLKFADIGSGIGRRHKYFPNYEYVGFDREQVMVDKGKEIFPDLTFHQVDIQELEESFPEYKGAFDLALTFHVIQYNHVEQQDEMIKGINFILKPGGKFYMKENTIYQHNNIGYKDLSETHSINDCSYTSAGWIAKLERLGFSCLHHRGPNGHYLFQKV